MIQFLREFFFVLILSPLLRSLRFPSQHHFGTPWCVVLGLHLLFPSVFRPIEYFLYEGLQLLVVFFLPCLEKAPSFSHIHSILASTRNLIYNTLLSFTKRLLTCAFNIFYLSSGFESNSKRVSVSSSPELLRQPF